MNFISESLFESLLWLCNRLHLVNCAITISPLQIRSFGIPGTLKFHFELTAKNMKISFLNFASIAAAEKLLLSYIKRHSLSAGRVLLWCSNLAIENALRG